MMDLGLDKDNKKKRADAFLPAWTDVHTHALTKASMNLPMRIRLEQA